ncbi:hypothetical protein AMATHDRAFT_134467 [Amanita thiersii Skay4041]|uniref:P-loop containing nucleoside triphosphate hydrolase protein n=1 Tax=Amanita thiersii Skay4041 TaxID=703135 RepID=A0A2A9NTX2_9AGAR|nr:hypothetical protein AMATHDRAFT_134467 [Amanita thiersii Skay4041]
MQCLLRPFISHTIKAFCLARYSTAPSHSIVLRPYQEQCLDACTDALENGFTRIGVSLPTGSGKTTVFISLLSRISPPAANPTATSSLIVVNSVELARQSAEQVARLFPDWTVEIEQGTKYKASGAADVTVATYQTLLSNNRLAKFDPNTTKAIIVDEAHHAAAPSYRKLLSYFDSSIQHPDVNFIPPVLNHKIPIIGFSATFSRHDGLALGSVFERIVYHRDFLNMIKDQWLCNVCFTSVQANINLKSVTVNSRTGDFNPSSLAQVINTDTINNLVVRTWLDRASERKSTLVFCVNVSHVLNLTRTFRKYGIDARYVYSGTPAFERKALVAAFKAGEFPVLLNCAILTEGADIPNIDCVVVARPTRSRNIFAQMIGRGMRLSPVTDKTDCRIIDFVDSVNRVVGVVSTPTLFGLDPGEISIDDETLESLEKRAQELISLDTQDDVPAPTTVTYTDYDNPFSLVEGSSGAPHISAMSKNAWVGCGKDIYVLECLGKGFVRVEPVKDENAGHHYQGYYTPVAIDRLTAAAFKMSPYFRSRPILTGANLSDAIRGCDTYVQAKVARGTMALGLLRSAKWRKQPATDSQKELISKRWTKHSSDEEKKIKIKSLTKGQAANILTRLKHGAQVR